MGFSEELLNQWYGWLPSQAKWVNKFANNANRMKVAFERGQQRCGHYNEDQLPHGGPADRTKQITTGYKKWAERYISQCSGQRTYKFQVERMARWNNKLQAHLVKNKDDQ